MVLTIRILVAAAIALLAGCANLYPSEPRVVVNAAPFNAVEREFATKIATNAVYEIEVSRLAAERATRSAVRDYAQDIVARHTQMNDELVRIMSAHGVAPPRGLAADKATKLHRLASLPRSEAFDSGYIRVVGIEDHRNAIARFERARREVHDRDLRAWIERWLVEMRAQLANAQGVAATLAG